MLRYDERAAKAYDASRMRLARRGLTIPDLYPATIYITKWYLYIISITMFDYNIFIRKLFLLFHAVKKKVKKMSQKENSTNESDGVAITSETQ